MRTITRNRISYKNALFCTTTCAARTLALMATLSNAMASVTDAWFKVVFTDVLDEDEEYKVTHYLELIAKQSGNQIEFHCRPGLSVAKSKKLPDFAADQDFLWFINLDDDLHTTYELWNQLYYELDGYKDEYSGVDGIFTVGVVDADNSRGYDDYDDHEYESVADYLLSGKEESKLKHHFITEIECVDTQWLSQLYVLPRKAWEDAEVWDPILERFAEKGKRGYDIMLEEQLCDRYPMYHITGIEAIHFGLEHGYIGGNWNVADKVALNVVNIGKDYATD